MPGNPGSIPGMIVNLGYKFMEKFCSKCKQFKEEREFSKCSKRKCGIQVYCKECSKNHSKIRFQKNPEPYLARTKISRLAIKSKIDEIKNVPCMDCGNSFPPYVMDFDHISNKEFNIGSDWRKTSWVKILKEIQKCEIICSNCHRIRTESRRKEKNQLGHGSTGTAEASEASIS